MATDPTAILSGLIQNVGNPAGNFIAGQEAAQKQQLQQQTLQANQLQFQDAARQQAQAARYQQDVQSYLDNGSKPADLQRLAIMYPQQAKAFQDVAKLKSDDQHNADLQTYGSVYNALDNDKPDLAASALEQRRDAERAQNIDTSEIDQIITGLKSGDPAAAKLAKGWSLSQIYAHDPDNFAKVFNLGDKGDKTHVITPGGALVDDTGHELYHAGYEDKPDFRTVKNADGSESIIQVGGGPRAGGTAAGATRRMGWTPSTADGGDNPPAAVANKIALVAKAAGIDPDQPLTREQVMALPIHLGEGGAGSLADRNNNPGNIRNPDGSYRKFPTLEAGQAATSSQLGRFYDRGQRTIRDIVAGKPVSGGASGDAAKVVYTGQGNADGGGGGLTPEALNYASDFALANGGKLPQGFARNKAAMVALQNAIAAKAAARGMTIPQVIQSGQDVKAQGQTLVAFDKGKQGDQVRSLNVGTEHLDQLGHLSDALGNGNIPLFNGLRQQVAKSTGSAVPTNFDGVKQFVTDEVVKAIIGAGGGVADRQSAHDIISRTSSPTQLSGAIQQIQGMMAAQVNGLRRQYETGTGRTDFDARLSPRMRQLAAAHNGGGGASIVTVTSPQQAAALPSGTMFRTPDGRTLRKR